MPLDSTLDTIDPDLNYLEDFQSSLSCNNLSVDEFCTQISDNNMNMFSFINYNVRSFRANDKYILPIIEKSNPHAIVLTETWFTDDYQGSIMNYDSFHTIRSQSRSGGVSIYSDNKLTSQKIENLSYANINIELCSVKIILCEEPIFIIGIYRPHSGTIDSFCDEIANVLQNPILRNRRCFLTGDFNINMLHESHPNSHFVDTLQSHHFFPVISLPTRYSPIDNVQPSLIDHIWCNTLSIYNASVLKFDLTDHCPTSLQFPLPVSFSNENDFIKITFRVNNQENRDRLRQVISDFDWSTLETDDINTRTVNFTRKLDSLYCETFPLKTKYIPRKKAMNPWFTPELCKLVQTKSVYFDMMRIGAISKQENNIFKNKCKSAIHKAKSAYYKNLLERNFGNMRSTWTILNSLMNNNRKASSLDCIIQDSAEIRDDSMIASVFSDYFYNITAQLNSNIPVATIDPLTYINNDIISTLSNFEPCTPTEVSNLLENLKKTKQSKNCIPIKLVISNRDLICTFICNLINCSMSQGVFPQSLKLGKILPIHKRGDSRTPANFRPISLLPYLSKVFEKVVFYRLLNHLNNNNILTPYQFGFRKNMSTLDALIHFTELMYDSLNDRKTSLNVLIDFSKAFDTVNHDILLRKLRRYGVCGSALLWFESYLKDREQYVSIRDKSSEIKVSNISVPQGSVLGTILFLIYVNCLPNVSEAFSPTIFADDCTLSVIGLEIENITAICNAELADFESWAASNKLSINIDKTKCLLISNIYHSDDLNIFLNGQNLEFVDFTKFLGVTIDRNLKYDKHIEEICSKVSKSLGIIYRIRDFIPYSCLRNLYFNLIHPYLIYCLPIFGATYNNHLQPLILLQKRAIRTISRAGYFDSSEPLFKSHKILKFQDLYKHSLACYVFKHPDLINSFSRTHDHNTRNRNLLLPPLERLRSTNQSVIFNSITIWNDIPDDIKVCTTLDNFKFRFRKYLLEQYAT